MFRSEAFVSQHCKVLPETRFQHNFFCSCSSQKAIKEKDIPIEGREFMGPSKGKAENSS